MGVVRTLDTNLCVNQDLSIDKVNSEVTINLMKLSQILATTGISSSQEERVLAIAKNLSTSPKVQEESRSYELHKDFPCKTMEEAETLRTIFDGVQPCQPENEEFPTCTSTDPSCTTKINHLQEEDLYQDYIEIWFQEVTRSQCHSLVRHFLLPNQIGWLILHT